MLSWSNLTTNTGSVCIITKAYIKKHHPKISLKNKIINVDKNQKHFKNIS